MKKLHSPSTPESGRFEKHEVPVFAHETSKAAAHGFTESSHSHCLCYECDDVMVVRYQDPDGIDPNNCIYHVYKKEIDDEGNLTGNASTVEKILVSEGMKKCKKADGSGYEMVEEFRSEAAPYSLQDAFVKAKQHKRNKP